MNKLKRYLYPFSGLLVLFLFLNTITCPAQSQKPVNLNQKNGLPTDFIYDMVVDKYGYLWLGTPKGVVKYNGYETKLFDFSSGLPSVDIWSVLADNRGRVFFGTHSNRIGYIQNDSVKLLVNNGFNDGLSPRNLAQFKNGISWLDFHMFFYEKKDTLYKKMLPNTLLSYIDDSGIIYTVMQDYSIGKITSPDSLFHRTLLKNNLKNFYPFHERASLSTSFGKDLIIYKSPSDTIWIFNQDAPRYTDYSYLFPQKPHIISIFEKKGKLIVRYDQGFLFLNKQYQPLFLIPLNKSWLPDINGYKIPIAIPDPLWDTCIATNTNGLYIVNNRPDCFKQATHNLNNYQLIKTLDDNTAIWWSPSLHKGIFYKNETITHNFSIPQYNVRSAVELDSNRIFLFTNGMSGFWYYPETAKLIAVDNGIGFTHSAAFDKKKNNLYLLTASTFRICHTSDTTIGNSKTIKEDRYKEVFYDAYYNINIIYNYDKIIIVKDKQYRVLNRKSLHRLGIGNIEIIKTDNKGNLFIKDNEKVVCINMERLQYKILRTHTNFSDAQMALKNNMLILGGEFGIAIYKIDKELTFPQYIYRNIKNAYFYHLYDLQVNDSNIFFTSDEGSFTVALPADSAFSHNATDDIKYKLLLKYSGTNYLSGESDTIKVNQGNLLIGIDIVNPSGTGNVTYRYNIEQTWNDVNGNQLVLANPEPGKYLMLSVIAKDNTWISSKNSFVIYIVPYWWQTTYGKALIALCILIFLALVAFAAFLTTRIIIKKRTERNQLLMDIELKAIYSQINPHFIFNTLSGTQYFIRENKPQEARLHLNKFSRLLRSYIHSSRNKYISIKDELVNIINYIELQQIRFADKFDYEVTVDPGIETEIIKIPSLLLQPIVENAINHGLFHVEKYKGLLKLEFAHKAETNEIICTIDDNGIGRQKAREIKADSIIKTQSYGDALIKDLINIFNKYEKLNIEIRYIDKTEPLTGTTVIIKIKNPVHEKPER